MSRFMTPEQRRWSSAIKAARRQLGLTQKQAADHLGVAQSTLSEWESGKKIPAQRLQGIVVRGLGIEPALVAPDWAAA